jgi:PAS domain S-box-containing protein
MLKIQNKKRRVEMLGKPNEEELESILETLPLEFSVLNEDDEVLAWNKHETRIFKRPEAALGRNVRQCHPPKSVDKVEKIISEMKEGKRDVAEFWIDLPIGEAGAKRKILIRYFALRDKDGKYLGCLEASMDITDIQKIKGEKRLLD